MRLSCSLLYLLWILLKFNCFVGSSGVNHNNEDNAHTNTHDKNANAHHDDDHTKHYHQKDTHPHDDDAHTHIDGHAQGNIGYGMTLKRIQERDILRCGIRAMKYEGSNGETFYKGIEADLCRAVSLAVLGEEKIEFTQVSSPRENFNSLNDNAFDVLFGGTTATLGRDTVFGLTFSQPIFYDAWVALIRNGAEYEEQNFYDTIHHHSSYSYCTSRASIHASFLGNIVFPGSLLFFDTIQELYKSLMSGECDFILTDMSIAADIIGPEVVQMDMGKTNRLLGQCAVTQESDQQWSIIVNAVLQGLIIAEWLDISQNSVLILAHSTDYKIKDLLHNNLGLPLSENFMSNVILGVGNYGELYARYLESIIPRVDNQLWSQSPLGKIYPHNLWASQSKLQTIVNASHDFDHESTYLQVKEKGILRCGIITADKLFVRGFFPDLCLAIAAAASHDGEEIFVEYIATNITSMISQLVAGEFDVLASPIVNSIGNQNIPGVMLSSSILFDSLSIEVLKDNVDSYFVENQLVDFSGVYCISQQSYLDAEIIFEIAKELIVDANATVYFVESIIDGQISLATRMCDIFIAPRSQLMSTRLPKHSIIDFEDYFWGYSLATFDDRSWADSIDWIMNGLLLAEYFGISGSDIDIVNFETMEGEAKNLFINYTDHSDDWYTDFGYLWENGFMRTVLKKVGNYKEIYTRNLEYYMERSMTPNMLWVHPNGLLNPNLWYSIKVLVEPDVQEDIIIPPNDFSYLLWIAYGVLSVYAILSLCHKCANLR